MLNRKQAERHLAVTSRLGISESMNVLLSLLVIAKRQNSLEIQVCHTELIGLSGSKNIGKHLKNLRSANLITVRWSQPTFVVIISEEVNKILQTWDIISKDVKNDKIMDQKIDQVIQILNEKTGRGFKGSQPDRKVIRGRIRDGYSLEDFELVISTKTDQWLNDEEMSKFLRPSTLFSPSKFDSYLQESRKAKPDQRVDDMFE